MDLKKTARLNMPTEFPRTLMAEGPTLEIQQKSSLKGADRTAHNQEGRPRPYAGHQEQKT